jgi:metal-responsive CopG/Arc/MetJ family transcriptional regulator
MAFESEKITINMSVVDLGKVDLLVDESMYANRTDFIRTAIRNQLERHDDVITQSATRKSMAIGVLTHNRADLERTWQAGQQLKISVVGLLILADDISPELALETIASIRVAGVFRASPAVRTALRDRIH